MAYNLTAYEQETIINFNNGEQEASIYTCNKALMKKLDNFCKRRPDLYKLDDKNENSKTYLFPKNLVTLRVPKVLTQKQRENMAANIKDRFKIAK